MKAIVLKKYGSPNLLELSDVQTPTPQGTEVLVRVRAAAVNDWDWSLVRGTPFYIRLLAGLLTPNIKIPGAEISGHVVASGGDATKFQPGDEVYGDLSECGFGGFAEYACVPENALAKKPASMSFVDAAALPHAGMLALQGLCDIGDVKPGQTVLINGAGGGVGTLGVQIATSLGIAHVTGVDCASKAETMRSAGFERTIDYRQNDFTRNGQAYDLILDTKTNRSPLHYLRALKPQGTYVTVGGNALRLLQALVLGPLIHAVTKKRIRIVALKPNRDLDHISALYESGKIRPQIDGPYSLGEAPQAIQRFGEGKHKGKVIIALNPD